MAVTDRSTQSGVQPRVWTVSAGRFLTTRQPGLVDGGWDRADTLIHSTVDGVSWTDGSIQRERVFYFRTGDQLWMNNFDNDHLVQYEVLPAAPTGLHFNDTGLAAVAWDDGGTLRIAVAAVANGGRVCAWRGTFATGSFGSPFCTSSPVASTTYTPPDIDGVVLNSIPWFGFLGANGDLTKLRYSGGAWLVYDLGKPSGETSLRRSIQAYSSWVESGKVEAVLAGNSGTLYAARTAPLGTTASWHALPAMPNGASPPNQPNTLAATPYSGLWGAKVMVYVLGSGGRVYNLDSDTSGDLSQGTWQRLGSASGDQPPDESWLGNGAASPAFAGLGDLPTLWGTAGTIYWPVAETTLQRFTGSEFDDHIRYRGTANTRVVLGEAPAGTYHPANEGQTANVPIGGFAAAIRRNAPPPWQVTVADSSSAGDLWTLDQIVQPAAGWNGVSATPSMTDPTVAAEPPGFPHPYREHVDVLEWDVTPNVDGTCTYHQENGRVVYRRGTNAAAIASSTTVDNDSVFLVADEANLDHPALTLTVENGETTGHVVYWNGTGTYHWHHNDVAGTTGSTFLLNFDPAPPSTFTDAGNRAYAYIQYGDHIHFCRLQPFSNCAQSGIGDANFTPNWYVPTIKFPPDGPSDPRATCSGSRCFAPNLGVSFVAHPTVPGRLFIAYTGRDASTGNTRSSLYFLRHDEGSMSLSTWTTPVRVAGGDGREYIDPQLTVGEDSTLFLTYSVADNPELDVVEQYIAWSTDGGSSWSTHALSTTWDPNGLPFHCGRAQYFLGDYHIGSVLGDRTYHLLHRTDATVGSTVLAGLWSSRWSIDPY